MDSLVLEIGPAAAVLWGSVGAWSLGELVMSRRQAGGGAASDPSYVAMSAGIALSFLLSFAAASLDAWRLSGGRTWPAVAGICLVWTGIALRVWSIRTLGRFFTYAVTVAGDQRVVRSGPYRALRHPSYTGLLIGVLGIGLALGSWLTLITAVAPPLCAVLIRIRVEEAAMSARLGDEYRDYAAATRRLVPGVW
jgi:protein-S-isoprenylcysteine O-methyltransferase Ste14